MRGLQGKSDHCARQTNKVLFRSGLLAEAYISKRRGFSDEKFDRPTEFQSVLSSIPGCTYPHCIRKHHEVVLFSININGILATNVFSINIIGILAKNVFSINIIGILAKNVFSITIIGILAKKCSQ